MQIKFLDHSTYQWFFHCSLWLQFSWSWQRSNLIPIRWSEKCQQLNWLPPLCSLWSALQLSLTCRPEWWVAIWSIASEKGLSRTNLTHNLVCWSRRIEFTQKLFFRQILAPIDNYMLKNNILKYLFPKKNKNFINQLSSTNYNEAYYIYI